MPDLRSNAKSTSAPDGRVKAVSRASGSALALASTRPAGADTLEIKRSPLTLITVAHPTPLRGATFSRKGRRSAPTLCSKNEKVHQNSDFAAASAAPMMPPGTIENTTRNTAATARTPRSMSVPLSNFSAGSSKYISLTMRR